MKILIVDDKKEELYLLETILKGSDYLVVPAGNGAEALEKLYSVRFDMIISDILMPVMDGYRLCREVKKDEKLKDIPFVFYTATYTDENDEKFALELGADKFIRKPIEPGEFIKIIQDVIKDVEVGKKKAKKPVLEEEEEIFKLYSERLVNKLEKKMIDLKEEITKRKEVEDVLRKSEKKYRILTETVPDIIFTLDKKGRFTYISSAGENIVGYSIQDFLGHDFTEILAPEYFKSTKDRFKRGLAGEKISLYEVEIMHKDGQKIPVELNMTSLFDKDGNIISRLGVARDITVPKRAQEKIKASLREKEVLLQEIHHRVKNNMQIVISLLRLQSRKVEDKNMQEMFRECQNRIRIMALIHEKLYQSKDFARINFAQYIDGLMVHVFQSYSVDSNLIAMKTDLEEVFFNLNQAIPCGLIVNELLSNSIKHAFPEGKKGEIRIKLHSDKKGVITLVVSDNGIGFPKNIDFRKAQSLGLQMVNDLTNQINGTIELDRKGGTAFKVVFSVNK